MTARLNPLYPVKRIDANKQHYYQIGEDSESPWLPGVTTVLKVLDKPAILPWALKMMGENLSETLNELKDPLNKDLIEKIISEAKNIYKKKASDAANLGSRVHQAVDAIIHGQKPDITDDIKAGVDGFLAWQDKHKFKIELGDTKLASKLFGYGGSLDFIAFDGDDAILFDLKTTKKRKDRDHGAYDEMALQLASYCQAFQETYGIRVKDAYVLWVNKEKPEFKAVRVSNIQGSLEGFLAALKLHKMAKYEYFDEQPKI